MVGEVMDMVREVMDIGANGLKTNQTLPAILGFIWKTWR